MVIANPTGTPTYYDYFHPYANPAHPNHNTNANYAQYSGLGGSDESYDAVDYQNMFLAMLPQNPGEQADPSTQLLTDAASGSPLVIPSFHRPALINFWGNQIANLETAANVAMLRKVLLRPNWHDHPSFSGSNPEFAAINPSDLRSRLEHLSENLGCPRGNRENYT